MGVLEQIRQATAGHEHDPHGQAPAPGIHAAAVVGRQVDELVGLIKGVLADGAVAEAEARFLLDWLTANAGAREAWPANVIYPRLLRALSDDHLDADEESEILALLVSAVGGNATARGEASMSTALPITRPEPQIVFAGRAFAFTGKFYSGTREWCEAQVAARGQSGRGGCLCRLISSPTSFRAACRVRRRAPGDRERTALAGASRVATGAGAFGGGPVGTTRDPDVRRGDR